MERGVDAVLSGRLGQFWEWTENGLNVSVPPMVGWLRQDGQHVDVLVAASDDVRNRLTDPHTGSMRAAPIAVLGVLEGETVLLLGMSRSGMGMRSGNQPMMETVRYRAHSLVVGVQKPQALVTARLTEASVVFPGMLRWAGYESFDARSETDDEGLVVSSVINLLPLPDTPAGRIARGRSIELSTRWSFRENNEQPAITTGLQVRFRAVQPVPISEVVQTLKWVQFALALAYNGWVEARPGFAKLDATDRGDERIRPEFWSGELTVSPGEPTETELIPFFTLSDLGAARGMARWVRICEENRRVVDPLLSFRRNGSASVYDHINAMCSAIEYLAASRKGQSGWGDRPGQPSRGLGKLHVAARRLGAPWVDFVGGFDRWAELTWQAYLNSKHFRPGRSTSMKDLYFLAFSAELVLTAVLLDEAAGSKKVSRRMLDHHTLYGAREHLRAMTM
jgi:hypothetical protein